MQIRQTHLKEIKERGTLYFPIEHYYVTDVHPQYIMPLHWHEEIEIIRISEGCFVASLDNDTIYAHAGDVLIVNSGFLHGGQPLDCVYECIVFNPIFINGNLSKIKFLELLESHSIFLNSYIPSNNDELHHAFNTLFTAMREKNDGYDLTTVGCIFNIFGLMNKHHLFSAIGHLDTNKYKNIEIIKNILTYIDTHFNEQITLQDLSDIANMSPKYFCRFFNEMTNHTPIDYVNYYRIEYACELLSSTTQSILEVAMKSGFNDLSYFIKTFKKHKKITPKQYAKKAIVSDKLL